MNPRQTTTKTVQKRIISMRKYIFVALVASCLTVPGMAKTNFVVQLPQQAIRGESERYQIAPELVEAILQAAAEECSYDYCDLQQMWRDGEILI